MRGVKVRLFNGVLLFAISFWLAEGRGANHDFLDNISIDNGPWQPITNNRDPQRPSSPKFPNRHVTYGSPQWQTSFSRPSLTTELPIQKYKEGNFDRIHPNNKPKFPPLSVDGYKTYSAAPILKPFDSYNKPPLNPYMNHDYRPYQEPNKRAPWHTNATKIVKENPSFVYKENLEPPPVTQRFKPAALPPTFEDPVEVDTGPAVFPPQGVNADSRKKIKLPPNVAPGYHSDKFNPIVKQGNRHSYEVVNDNGVREVAINDSSWRGSSSETPNIHPSKTRGNLKFHPNGVSTREVPQAESPVFESSTISGANKIPKIVIQRKSPQNQTTTIRSEQPVRQGAISSNDLKGLNRLPESLSNTAQFVEDPADDEDFRPVDSGADREPENNLKEENQIRNGETGLKKAPQADPLPAPNSDSSSKTPQFAPVQNSQDNLNTNETFQPANELANTVPVLDGTVQTGELDRQKEPAPVVEDTSRETKKKFPFKRPQLSMVSTSTERYTTTDPPRRLTLKPGLKTRLNLSTGRVRTTTPVPTTVSPVVAETTIKVKNYKEDGSVQSNDIPLKPSIRPMAEFNNRRRPVNKPAQNQNDLNIPPTGWALASLKAFNNTRATRRPVVDLPAVGITELPSIIKPFVTWSTRLQKLTTTPDSSLSDTTTEMEDSDIESTTLPVDTNKNVKIQSSEGANRNEEVIEDFEKSDFNSSSSPVEETLSTLEDGLEGTEKDSSKSVSDVPMINKNLTTFNANEESLTESSNSNSEGDTSNTESVINSPEREIKGNRDEPDKNVENSISNSKTLFDRSKIDKEIFSNFKNELNGVKNISSNFNSTQMSITSISPKTEATETLEDANSNFQSSSSSEELTEDLKKQSQNDVVELTNALNKSNQQLSQSINDLKSKPIDTIYLNDVKAGDVRLTNSVGSSFPLGKDEERTEVNNSSGHINFVNISKSKTDSSLELNNVPLLSSTESVPISKNYQNNSSQSSNELYFENDLGILKEVSSQLDLKNIGNKESEPSSEKNSLPNVKNVDGSPFEVFPQISSTASSTTFGTSSTEAYEVAIDSANIFKEFEQSSSTLSSLLNEANVSIDSSFMKPQSSNGDFKNSSDTLVSNKPFGDIDLKFKDIDETTNFGSQSEADRNNDETNPTENDGGEKSWTQNSTSIGPIYTSEIETSILSTESPSSSNDDDEEIKVSSETASKDDRANSSKVESYPSSSEFENIKETTEQLFKFDSTSATKVSTVKTLQTEVLTTQPTTSTTTTKMSTTTLKTTTTMSTTTPTTTTAKQEVINNSSDKADEHSVTEEDPFIETEGEPVSVVIPTSPSKVTFLTTQKSTESPAEETNETSSCVSPATCSIPLHLQLKIEGSKSEVCKTKNMLEKAIIQLFKYGTKRVQSAEQIKFINLNSEDCVKTDGDKMSDVRFYLVDGIGDFEQSINKEFIELWHSMRNLDYYPAVQSAHLIMNKDKNSVASSGSGMDHSEVGMESDVDHSSTRVVAAIMIICLALVCLVLVIVLLMVIRKRQKRFNYGQRCVPVTLDDYSLDNMSVYNSVRNKGDTRTSKRSYGNPAFDDPNGPSHPMNFAGLANFTADQKAMDEEFSAIPVITVKPDELPPLAEMKNRYANVIPLPETRVHLLDRKNADSGDYINANYVKGPKRINKFYIACQAPLQSTIEDFWRMIWEQQSKVILMLTDFFENGVEKCANYLPPSEVIDCHRVFGDFQVTLKKRENREKYIISSLQLKNLETSSWREVTHLWYTSWPATGVPNEESSIIAFLIEARVYMKNNTGPNVVHCSPGTGRTGTVIACDLCIRDFETTRMVDVPKCVYLLRRCRAGAVQTKQQYAFIYRVLNLYAAKLTGGGLDSI